MNIKSWMKYFTYFCIIFCLIYLDNYILAYLKEALRINFITIAIIMVINTGIGLLLGLEYLNTEMKKSGSWYINFPKLISMGLPSLYFSLSYFLIYSRNQFVSEVLTYPLIIKFINYNMYFIHIFQIVLGYVIITSFHKDIKKTL